VRRRKDITLLPQLPGRQAATMLSYSVKPLPITSTAFRKSEA